MRGRQRKAILRGGSEEEDDDENGMEMRELNYGGGELDPYAGVHSCARNARAFCVARGFLCDCDTCASSETHSRTAACGCINAAGQRGCVFMCVFVCVCVHVCVRVPHRVPRIL